MDINTMPAGREMDALIAERVMGWELVDNDYYILNRPGDPFYKTHPDPAGLVPTRDGKSLGTPSQVKWQDLFEELEIHSVGLYWIDPVNRSVVEADNFQPSTDIAAAWQVVERLEAINIGVELSHAPDDQWECWSLHQTEPNRYESWGQIWADTAPLAICRAALKAMEIANG